MKDLISNQQEPRNTTPKEVESPTFSELIDELIKQRNGDARQAVAWCLGYIGATETRLDSKNTLKHMLSKDVRERKAISNNPHTCLRCNGQIYDSLLCPACKQAMKEEKETSNFLWDRVRKG